MVTRVRGQHMIETNNEGMYFTLWVLSSHSTKLIFENWGLGGPKNQNKKKVLRIENSIRGSLSELKSSLSGLFRPSHLPYKAKSEKCSIFVLFFISPYFPYSLFRLIWSQLTLDCVSPPANYIALQSPSTPAKGWKSTMTMTTANQPKVPRSMSQAGPAHTGGIGKIGKKKN